MIPYVALLLFLITSSTALYTEERVTEIECLNYTIYPVQYELTITPFIEKNRIYYNCDVMITVITNVPNIRDIELDACDLEIIRESVKVFYRERDIINNFRPLEYDKKKGKLIIHLDQAMLQYSVYRAQYVIKMSFRKDVTSETKGIFVVPYEDDGTKYLFVTRLSPDKAKYFFPCFDDVRFESIFKFRVYHPPSSLGVQYANTSLVIAKEQRNYVQRDHYVVIEYKPSPQVTLHQVGFHYSQFGSRHALARDTNDTIAIWAATKNLHNYDFILNFSEKMLNMILEYSSNNLPLVNGPINIVSVPKNMDGYEIGSWNLLTNGENKLAYVPQFSSISQIERMTYELVMQLSGIWLGNPGELRRTRWRQEWFKEGVATYLAHYFLTQYQHGVTNLQYAVPLGMYGLQMKHKAMVKDWESNIALIHFNQTPAVNIPSRHTELVQMKTASLLWMVENWIGTEKFHKALVGFIKNGRGSEITVDKFLTYLNQETLECKYLNGSTASKILASWLSKSGYPVIQVNVLRDRTPNAIQLKQYKLGLKPENADTCYTIPVSYIVQHNQNCFNCYQQRFIIEDQTYSFEENLNDGWIILNTNASGYYRVNYDLHTWKLIAKTLREDRLSIPEQNRAQIVNDAFALYVSGEIDQALAVEILDYLDKETSPVVWQAAISGFELLKIRNSRCNMNKYLYEDWQDFMRKRVAPIYERVNGVMEHHSTNRMFRQNIVSFACGIGHQICLNTLRRSYDDYLGRRQRLDPDTRQTCYEILFKSGTLNDHSFNAFEVEDKLLAEEAVTAEQKWLYWLPQGTPVMDRLMVSSTPEPEPLSSSEIIREFQQSTMVPKGAPPCLASAIVLAVSALILSVLR